MFMIYMGGCSFALFLVSGSQDLELGQSITLLKGNLIDLRRILHLSLAKGNPRERSKDPWLGQSTIIYKGMQYQAS
jgi:hypothetical protein